MGIVRAVLSLVVFIFLDFVLVFKDIQQVINDIIFDFDVIWMWLGGGGCDRRIIHGSPPIISINLLFLLTFICFLYVIVLFQTLFKRLRIYLVRRQTFARQPPLYQYTFSFFCQVCCVWCMYINSLYVLVIYQLHYYTSIIKIPRTVLVSLMCLFSPLTQIFPLFNFYVTIRCRLSRKLLST